jgi:hypothetical protein
VEKENKIFIRNENSEACQDIASMADKLSYIKKVV